MSSKVLKGSCSCGLVQYTATALPTKLTNCHCTSCRKQAGAPYTTWASFPPGTLTWISPPTIRTTSDIAKRGHCSACGSTMLFQYHSSPERVAVSASSIDENGLEGEIPKPWGHIFLKEKAAWFDVPEDGLERLQGWPPGSMEAIDKWKSQQNVDEV